MNRLQLSRWLGHCLSPGKQAIGPAAPVTEEDWINIVALANAHLVSPLLHTRLRDRTPLATVPAEISSHLATLYELNLERNQALLQQAHEAIAALNTYGIKPLALKGIASLFTNLYGDDGARILGDIDLLLPEDKLLEGAQILESLGYRPKVPGKWVYGSQHHHIKPLIHPERRAAIELHWRLSARERVDAILPPGSALAQASSEKSHGVEYLLPTAEFRLLHNFLHSPIGNKTYLHGILHLRQLCEFAWLRHALQKTQNEVLNSAEIRRSAFRHAWQAWLLASEYWLLPPVSAHFRATSWLARLWLVRARLQMRHPIVNRLLTRFVYRVRALCPRPMRPLLGVGISD